MQRDAKMRIARRVLIFLAGAFTVVLAFLLAVLVFPGTPGETGSLRFVGFVALPGEGMIQVLDYLTVYRRDLFVTNVSTGDVYRIGLSTGKPAGARDIFVFPGKPAAHGVAIDPVSGLGFATRSGVNVVDAFDLSSMRLIRRIPVADDPDAILYEPKNRMIYAGNGDAERATLIDPAGLKAVATIALGGSPEFAVFDARTGLVYQNLASTNALVAVNLATRTIIWRYSLNRCEFPTGLAIDETGRRLFIACGKSARLVIFDPDRRHTITAVPIGFGPDSVAYDPSLRRIYTTGLMGTLSVIGQDSADAYHVRDTIRLSFNAHTLAIDPVTHSLFVGCTGFGSRPRLAVFSPTR